MNYMNLLKVIISTPPPPRDCQIYRKTAEIVHTAMQKPQGREKKFQVSRFNTTVQNEV